MPPILDYQTPPRTGILRRCLPALAIISALSGVGLTCLFLIGIDLGTQGTIVRVDPSRIGSVWLLPFLLLLWPLGFICGKAIDRWHERGLTKNP
jgi:hypothetical protein